MTQQARDNPFRLLYNVITDSVNHRTRRWLKPCAAPEELFGLLGGSVFVAVAQLQMREVPSWDDIKTVIKSAL